MLAAEPTLVLRLSDYSPLAGTRDHRFVPYVPSYDASLLVYDVRMIKFIHAL